MPEEIEIRIKQYKKQKSKNIIDKKIIRKEVENNNFKYLNEIIHQDNPSVSWKIMEDKKTYSNDDHIFVKEDYELEEHKLIDKSKNRKVWRMDLKFEPVTVHYTPEYTEQSIFKLIAEPIILDPIPYQSHPNYIQPEMMNPLPIIQPLLNLETNLLDTIRTQKFITPILPNDQTQVNIQPNLQQYPTIDLNTNQQYIVNNNIPMNFQPELQPNPNYIQMVQDPNSMQQQYYPNMMNPNFQVPIQYYPNVNMQQIQVNPYLEAMPQMPVEARQELQRVDSGLKDYKFSDDEDLEEDKPRQKGINSLFQKNNKRKNK